MILPKVVVSARNFASAVRTGGSPVGTERTTIRTGEMLCRAVSSILTSIAVLAATATSMMCTPLCNGQTIVAQSSFDSTTEQWTLVSTNVDPCTGSLGTLTGRNQISQIANGGSPAGYLSVTGGTGNSRYFRAPYVGNLSAAAGGAFTFSRRFAPGGTSRYDLDGDVFIQGLNTTLVADLLRPTDNVWLEQSIPMVPGFWRLNTCDGPIASESDIVSALTSVQNILIRSEYTTGGYSMGLDSVSLTGPISTNACEVGWMLTDDDAPSARWEHAVAIDPDRRVMVLFGGQSGESDTWEFNIATSTWQRFFISNGPTARYGHAMAYDSARQRIVMTGGRYSSTVFDEVWEYNAQSHSWSRAGSLPQARESHAMAYNPNQGVMYIYGGLASGVAGAQDILARSTGNSWQSIVSSAPNPQAQLNHSLAYDANRNKLVLIGVGTTNLDVWEWTPSTGTWEANTAPSTPTTRSRTVAVYDSNRQVCVVFGGYNTGGTFDFTGTAWSQRQSMPSASGRTETAGAFDPVSDRILAVGGFSGTSNVREAVYAFDGSSNNLWSAVTVNSTPTPRVRALTAYDEVGHRIIVHGGTPLNWPGITNPISSDTYSWNGSAWQLLNITGSTPPVQAGAMVYVSDRRTMLFYGGYSNSGASRDVWEFDLATQVWTDRTPPTNTPPGLRYVHAAAYDRTPSRRQVVVQGGLNENGTRLGDTWLYSPSTQVWQQVATGGPTPGLRSEAAMCFDEARNKTVLFGGLVGATGDDTYDDATWEWDGVEWREATVDAVRPIGRRRATMYYDPTRAEVVLFGGISRNGLPLNDLWSFNGNRWQPLAQSSAELPTARLYGAVAFDRERSQMVLFGGLHLFSGNDAFAGGQTWIADNVCGTSCDSIDFNNDTSLFDPQDIEAFLSVYSEGPCVPAPATCGDIDFNNDTSVFDPCDISSFLVVYSEGPCTPCGQ